MNKKYIFAGSAAALALLVAAPVLADEHGSFGGSGNVGFGSVIRFLDNHDGDRDGEHADRDKGDNDNDNDRDEHADVDDNVNVVGTVSGVSGSTITVAGEDGTVTVDASGATLSEEENTVALGDIKVGDTVLVHGSFNGSVVVADRIRDVSVAGRNFLSAIGAADAGVVTSINGPTFTLNSIGGTKGTTVTTNGSTVFKVNGVATTSNALATSSRVIVFGTPTSDTNIVASIVSIITDGFGFLVHLFTR